MLAVASYFACVSLYLQPETQRKPTRRLIPMSRWVRSRHTSCKLGANDLRRQTRCDRSATETVG
jgi:hypothetical protein